jgi:hypothetical protein
MSNDIYKILEGMDSVKPGHKDHVKGTDKPSKGEKKYDGPYTKHPFQGKLVGEVKEDEVAEEFNKFDNSEMMTEEQFDEAAGEKDACYHKVKSRYKVWPSAYASGALVQCRKKGAKNWGNKSKKKSNEGIETERSRTMAKQMAQQSQRMLNKATMEKYGKTINQFFKRQEQLDGKTVTINGNKTELEFDHDDIGGFVGVFDDYDNEVNPFTLEYVE